MFCGTAVPGLNTFEHITTSSAPFLHLETHSEAAWRAGGFTSQPGARCGPAGLVLREVLRLAPGLAAVFLQFFIVFAPGAWCFHSAPSHTNCVATREHIEGSNVL